MQSTKQFGLVVDGMFGAYLDAMHGFTLVFQRMSQTDAYDRADATRRRIRIPSQDELDSRRVFYGDGDPNLTSARMLHHCLRGEFKKRNSKNGSNAMFLAHSIVVALFQHWEDTFRSSIAAELAIARESLKVPIMGDLRLIRNAIIHNRGRAKDEIARCEVIRWFKPDERIDLSDKHMRELFGHVFHAISELEKNASTFIKTG